MVKLTNRYCVSVCVSVVALLIARRSDVCNCCVQILVYVVLVLKNYRPHKNLTSPGVLCGSKM